MSSADESLVQTDAGVVRGRIHDGVVEFRNIPYAAPPVGHRRFLAPEPVVPWEGEFDATQPFGPSAPQPVSKFRRLDVADLAADGWHKGDDYLSLNVWAPGRRSDRPRPVMVWIHGGAFTIGRKDLAAFNGVSFARSGVVIVVINYRLGVEGFLPIAGAPTNLGLRDMIAALHWVQSNVAAFGGDPGNVTIFGQSAGAISIASLVASPLTTGLFRRAILQSGGGTALPIDTAKRAVTRIAKSLAVPPDVEGFRSRTVADALPAMQRAARPGVVDFRDDTGYNPYLGMMLVGPVYGDDVVPQHPLTSLRHGAGRDVDLLIGTTADEVDLFFATTMLRFAPRPVARWMLRHVHPNGNGLYDAYARHHPERGAGMVWSAVVSDLFFRLPARQFAEAHQGRSHVYEFDWPSPALKGRLGAAHGLDIAFAFDVLSVITGPRRVGGEAPPQAVATHLHGLCVRFAEDGFVPWPQFDPVERRVYQIAAQHHVHEPVLPAADFQPKRKEPPDRTRSTGR
ncbi:carboxylesterase/lipase family protein [Amycolatopsis sp. NBC_01480]|uniref:carboxylesterase/lipase family protein n=1 Tax=Amycolatopsis sp. NBC_01480 TaxID=2903562 RepID=UPI002E2A475A|nr:carboxylesterase family protein [Amycolatopsis sp. NBC_01480]